MYLRHGYEFIDQFFIQHHFQRYTSNKYFHPQPFYFFLWVLPLMTIPWLPFFVAGVWNYCKSFFQRRDAETQSGAEVVPSGTVVPDSRVPARAAPLSAYAGGSDILRFSFAWMLVPLVFFSFSGSKL